MHSNIFTKLLVLILSLSLISCGGSNTSTAVNSCVLIDNDYDIDDMQAIPLVIGNKYVAAIIQSEGYTLPEEGAAAVAQLVNNLPDQPNQRKIPIIVGAKQGASGNQNLSTWPWLPFFRSMMNLSNGLLTALPTPAPTDPAYVNKVVESVANCQSVSILVIGTYTSFINYIDLIRAKVDRVVIMGQAIGDNSRTPGKNSFNCNYDLPACQRAMVQLEGLNTFFVDIPRDDGADPNLPRNACLGLTPSPNCYNPSYEMVAGTNGSGGLLNSGLPGRLKQALINQTPCDNLYTGDMPEIDGIPQSTCSGLSTWVPENVAAGPGGEMLLWDQTAAIFLINPGIFSLYYPPNDPSIGGKHYEPTVVNNSYAETATRLRALWTQYTNSSVNFINQE
jgi:inosine-uridine nucleoside N-ribohydrolase